MKKILAALTIAAFAAIAPPAMAGKAKVSKNICFNYETGFGYEIHQLRLKPADKATGLFDDTLTLLTITGLVINLDQELFFPVSGSAFFAPDDFYLSLNYRGAAVSNEMTSIIYAMEIETSDEAGGGGYIMAINENDGVMTDGEAIDFMSCDDIEPDDK
jgi:hypothetical protein